MTILKRVASRKSLQLIAVLVALFVAGGHGQWPIVHAQGKPIVPENAKTGAPQSEWDLLSPDAGDPSIQGFATSISVNAGETVIFKIDTDAASYTIDIYRLGFYGGRGARKVATTSGSAELAPPTFLAALPQIQQCRPQEQTTGLVDCGTWANSASWSTAGAVSGIYIAKLTRSSGGSSHIPFIVRDDARQADIVVQTSDTTWQAYNKYGGASLYCAQAGVGASSAGSEYAANCANRGTKVSYNRPFDTRGHDPQSFLFNAEYPMVRWLEANGYDVKYISGVDTDMRAATLWSGTPKPKVFLSSGHDEYWSAGQRASVEAARGAGVNLAFFSGNEMYWKTRYEADGNGTPYRTLVAYKDTLANAKIDPASGIATPTWRDLRFGPPTADGGRPENGVTGTIWTVNNTYSTTSITVPASMGRLRFWRNTAVASLAPNAVYTTSAGTLGYEWDEDLDNGARPGGLVHLSSTVANDVEKIVDFGAHTATGQTATHNLTLYRQSGALVFGAGTVQWAWGLDGTHDRGGSTPDQAMQQATMNLFADMGAQPDVILAQSHGLVPDPNALISADSIPPTSAITSPTTGSFAAGSPVTIAGTAQDGGGLVAAVEVSVDGGLTWHPAQGTGAWTYSWWPSGIGQVTIKSRAADDSGNIEAPIGPGAVVTVTNGCTSGCTSLWTAASVPGTPDFPDASELELGLKFRSDIPGFVRGVRFYKGAGNTGTHIGNLWTSTGTLLATATFVSETPSGWQQVLFAGDVPIQANTTYVVSYHTNTGHYAADGGYFSNVGVNSIPLHADSTWITLGNGAFHYGLGFPDKTFNATNYWVDLVFSANADTTPPQFSNVSVSALDGGTAVVSWTTDEPSTSRVVYSISSSGPTQEVSDTTLVLSHRVRLTGLTHDTPYYFGVFSTDASGNVGSAIPPVGGGQTGGPLGFTFSTRSPMLFDTSTADFSLGTLNGTYIAETMDGEVILAPTAGAEFSGNALPSGWSVNAWDTTGGSAIVKDGTLVVDGALVATCTVVGAACQDGWTLSPNHSLEFVATFTNDTYQFVGFGRTLNESAGPWALFGTGGTTDSLAMSTADGAGGGGFVTIDQTRFPGGLLLSPHRYRIDWLPGAVNYYVDGLLVGLSATSVSGPMRPIAASDLHTLGGKITVDWMRVSPFATAGSFTSRVFDGGGPTDWMGIGWTARGSVTMTVRAGNTPVPDGSWQVLSNVTPNNFNPPLHTRYVQYQADFIGDGNTTPELDDVMIQGAAAPTQTQPKPQNVTFTGAPVSAPFGSTFAVVATTDASPAITPVITAGGACSIAGNMVTMTSGTGICGLSASWPGNASYQAAGPLTQSTMASKINQSTTFTGAPASAAFGSTFSVAATTNASTTAVMTASGGCTIAGSLVKMTSGTTTCSVSANWAADANYNAASASQSTTASKINPMATSVLSSASATNYGQLVTLTASVTSDKGTPTGTVTYNDTLTYNGVTTQFSLGTATVTGPNAIYSTFALAAGKHVITATYSGDTNFNGSASSTPMAPVLTVTPVGIVSLNPTSVNFSGQTVGVASMAMPVTLTNIGTAPLAINGVQIAGDNPGDFVMSSNTCASSLAVGASCVVNVRFKPLATGTRTASVIFTDNNNGISGSQQPISLVGSSMSTSKADFTPKSITAGRTLWFASELTLAKGPRDSWNVFLDMSNHPVRVFVSNSSVTFTANGTNYVVAVPDALITFSPSATQSTTSFDTVNNRWVTTIPSIHPFSRLRQFDILGRIFASGAMMPVPAGGLPGGIKNVTWSAAYSTDTPGMQVQWRWGAAVYSTFSSDYNALKVKPADSVRAPWALMTNNDQAGTPVAYKQYFIPNGGGTADDADDFTGDQTPNVGVVPDVAQANIAPIPIVFPGVQAAGTTTAPAIATITNNHQTLSLIVSSLSVSGIDFTLVSGGTTPCSLTGPTTLTGGASCTVGVIFTPNDMGTRTGAVNIGFSTPPGIAADQAPMPFKLDIVGVAK